MQAGWVGQKNFAVCVLFVGGEERRRMKGMGAAWETESCYAGFARAKSKARLCGLLVYFG